MKRIIGLILAGTLAAAMSPAVASPARTDASSHRTRALHVTKVCPSSTYQGQPGGYCTITDSNLKAIPGDSKVFYFEAATADGVDSDLALYAGKGNVAFGHVTLSLTTGTGVIKFRGGTGDFKSFRARVDVTYDANNDVWHWDGIYRFRGHGH